MLRQILDDGSAEMDIYDLEALADAEDGFFCLYKVSECPKLKAIQLFINITGALVCSSEKGRSDVPAAGKNKTVVVKGTVGQPGQR